MAIGTDKEVFEQLAPTPVKTTGRPKVDRELTAKLINAGYSTRYIRRALRQGYGKAPSARTIRRIRQELKEQDLIKEEEQTVELDGLGRDFDEEMKIAKGSFYDWLTIYSPIKAYKRVYRFNKKTWEIIFNSIPLALVADPTRKEGDWCCQQFLKTFGDDKNRIRERKHKIRYMFRFLGRMDLCDRYLRTPEKDNPRSVREIPEISLPSFPEKLLHAIDEVTVYSEEMALALKFKLCTQMRTGHGLKELMGIAVGHNSGSWLLMENPHTFRGEIIGKQDEKWRLKWIPPTVLQDLWQLYQTRNTGDKLFQFDIDELRASFKEETAKAGLPPLRLHDLRKVSITWFWVLGVPLEVASRLNVGWKTMNTVTKHYLKMADLIQKPEREAYRQNIPDWFKEGLDRYA